MTRETYPVIFEKYKAWRETPDEEKITRGLPLTQREFAIHHGVSSEKTLSTWNKKIDESVEYSGEFNLKDYLGENLREIAESLVKIIKTGKNTKSIELALKALGELVEKREETHKFELTPADFANIGRATIEGLRADFVKLGGRCPVCGEFKEICQPSEDTRPELPADNSVGAVALST